MNISITCLAFFVNNPNLYQKRDNSFSVNINITILFFTEIFYYNYFKFIVSTVSLFI